MTEDTDDTTTTESTGSETTTSTRDAPADADAAADPTSDVSAGKDPASDLSTGDTSAGTGGDAPAGDADGGRSREVVKYVNYLVLVALVVLALVSGIQFYGAVSRTINQWVTAEYRSLFHGAFNLAVLLIAAAGISRQVRRVTS